jgi:hypothetical protein
MHAVEIADRHHGAAQVAGHVLEMTEYPHASAPIPKFASSPYRTLTNFGIEGH